MKTNPLALLCLMIAFLLFVVSTGATCYLGFAAYRVSNETMVTDSVWPRPFPFPDPWLVTWHDELLAARGPVAGIDMHGELPALRIRVYGLLGISLFLMLGIGLWLRECLQGKER